MSPFPSKKKPWSRWHKRLHEKLQRSPNLLPSDSYLLIALSGGQDSMALLKIILDLKRIYKWEVFIWHGDHGWHNQSKQTAKELKIWCEEKSLNFFSDITNQKTTKSEADAREWRYSCLTKLANKICSENSTQKEIFILTAHTSSDRAETFIFNLSRGTDLAGLCSLAEYRTIQNKITLVRPFLIFSRVETAKICEDFLLPIWLDPTNENTQLSRNKIRHNIMPILERINPGSSQRISDLSERISSKKKEEEELISLALESLILNQGICRKKLNKLSANIKTTVLAYWLKTKGVPTLTAKSLKELSLIVEPEKPPGTKHLGKGWHLIWLKESIEIDQVIE
tara:strand:- start:692 stop:1711 length:1020 start_codon:yes stop_codon:yes gene_type:complete